MTKYRLIFPRIKVGRANINSKTAAHNALSGTIDLLIFACACIFAKLTRGGVGGHGGRCGLFYFFLHYTMIQQRIPDPCALVIFGASGDLTRRKLVPAIWHLHHQGRLPQDFHLVGVAPPRLGRRPLPPKDARIPDRIRRPARRQRARRLPRQIPLRARRPRRSGDLRRAQSTARNPRPRMRDRGQSLLLLLGAAARSTATLSNS